MQKVKFYTIEQHFRDGFMFQTNPEWLKVRKGRITGTDIIALFQKSDSMGYQDLVGRIAMERATDIVFSEKHITGSMERGLEYEDEARQAFIAKTGKHVAEFGFIGLDDNLGFSPDGIIPDLQETLEIKIPEPENFVSNCTGKAEKTYSKQCLWSLKVLGYKTCNLWIYSPELKTGYLIKIDSDPDFNSECNNKIAEIEQEIAKQVKFLQAL